MEERLKLLADKLLDKISRITRNPDMAYMPSRVTQRLKQLLYKLKIYKIPAPAIMKSFDQDLSLSLLEGERLTERMWFGNYVQYNEEYFYREYVSEGMNVIDAGANIGHISLICAKRVGDTGSVHSFEPVTATYEMLCKNIEENAFSKIIHANRNALSDKSGDLVSLNYCAKHSDLTYVGKATFEVQEGWTQIHDNVSTATIDEYVESRKLVKIDLLKIDIEGSEIAAIKGGAKMILRDKPAVVCEFNDDALRLCGGSAAELWDLLKSLGYSFYVYNHRARTLALQTKASRNNAPTYVGALDINAVADRLRARIL